MSPHPAKEASRMLQRLSVVAFLILVVSWLAIPTASGYRGDETPDLTSLSDADLKKR
jgi:hypothetical protein